MKKIVLTAFFAASLAAVVSPSAASVTNAPSAFAPWFQAESTHFLFIYQEQDRPAVNELLGFCEEAYEKVTGFFKAYPSKIPVIVFGRTETANGWTSIFPRHILVNTAAPPGVIFGSKNKSWLQLVLTHELVHYVHMSIDRGFVGVLSHIFGRDIGAIPVLLMPGWMVEGPSTELETLFTEGGRGRNPWWEWYTKAPVMEGKLWSLNKAAYPSAYPPGGHRIYVSGRDMVDYILGRFGGDSFTKIMYDYLDFPFFGPWGAIKRVTGETASRIWADMSAELAVKYSADAALAAGRPYTPDRIADFTRPQATSRGLYLLRSDLESFSSIISYDPATKKETAILEADLADTYSFAADASGEKIWLSAMRYEGTEPPQSEGYSDLYSFDVDARRLERLTHGARLIQPAVSANGMRLLAVQLCGWESRLVVVDRSDGTCRAVFSRAGALITAPAVSPNGRFAAFTMNVNGFQDVYVLDLERAYGSSAIMPDPMSPVTDLNVELADAVLGPDPFGEYMPAFESNDVLLFSSDRTGSLCLYRAELATEKTALIQRDPVGAGSGIMVGDSLLYGSFTSKGACLKQTPASSIVPEYIERGTPQEYPAPLPVASSVVEKPYHDLPKPLFWLPVPIIASTGFLNPEWGLGIQTMGASILGKWSWTAEAGWLFTAAQPDALLVLSGYLHGMLLQSSIGLHYFHYGNVQDPAGDLYAQSLVGSASLSVPLLFTLFLNSVRSMQVDVGASYVMSFESGAPFTVAASLSGAGLTGSSYTTLDSGFSFLAYTLGGSMDMFAPWSFSVSLSNTLLPPLLSSTAWGDLVGLEMEADIPSFLDQVLKLGVKASYGTGSYGPRADGIALPRGGFSDPFPGVSEGRILAALDYLVPIALLDAPLIFGLNLTELAAGIHAEGAAAWGLFPGSFTLSSSIWIGVELMATVGFNSVTLPLCVGLAGRIDTANPASFSAATDLKVYIITNFDSFARAFARGGRGETRPRL